MRYIQEYANFNAALSTIDKISADNNLQPEAVALKVVENNREKIEDYIAQNNIVPAKNPASLAVQATLIHEGKVYDKIDNGVKDYFQAGRAVMQDEIDFFENGIYSDFIGGSLLGSILSAGKAGIDKINTQRTAKGKKPILSGKFYQNLKTKVGDKVQVIRDDNGYKIEVDAKRPQATPDAQKSALDLFITGAVDDVERQKKREVLRKSLPYVIGGVLATILIIVLLRKK